MQLSSTGAIDTSFNPGTGANSTINAIVRQPDGKILVGGDFTSFNGTTVGRIARLNPDGSLDTSFATATGTGAGATVYDIIAQPDGKILLCGDFITFNGVAAEYLVRLNADGSRDSSFTGPDFAQTSGLSVRSLAMQSDGKYLAAGYFYFSGVNRKSGICRITSTGSLDGGFSGIVEGAHAAGTPSTIQTIEKVAVQADGKIVIAGSFTGYNNTGRVGLARLTSTGALDTGFNPAPNGNCSALIILPDQSILIGGAFTTVGGTTATRIARITSNGALDSNFAAAGGHTTTVRDFALQPDGNVILGADWGYFQSSPAQGPLWRFVPGIAGTPGVIQLDSNSASVNGVEGTTATLNVTRTGGSLGALTIGYSTVVGTASTSDFTTTSGTLSWASGNTDTKTISIPITADALADSPETFVLNLGVPLVGGSILGERQQSTITINTGFQNWLSTYFSPSELTDPNIVGDDKDPDRDGLTNLTEFALGCLPKTPDRANAWTTAVQNVSGTKYLTLTFRRRVPSLDLTYTVETNGTLNAGSWSGTAVIVGSPVNNGDGTETVTFRDSVSTASATRRFMRVTVTRTP